MDRNIIVATLVSSQVWAGMVLLVKVSVHDGQDWFFEVSVDVCISPIQ